MESQTLRPHPRFAGIEVLIAHGTEMVQEGASQGDPHKVIAGFLLVVSCLGAAAISILIRRWLSIVGVGWIAAAFRGRGGGRHPVVAAQPSAAAADIPLVAVVGHQTADGGEKPEMAAVARAGPFRTYL